MIIKINEQEFDSDDQPIFIRFKPSEIDSIADMPDDHDQIAFANTSVKPILLRKLLAEWTPKEKPALKVIE